MNYQNIYDKIIENAKLRGDNKRKLDYYTQRHHIIPKCIGGIYHKSNTALLKFREHFICHHLLVKIHPNNKLLQYAFFLMSHVNNIRLSSKQYEISKNLFKNNMSGKNNPFFGKTHTDENKLIIGYKSSLKIMSDSSRKLIGAATTSRKHTDETKKLMSLKNKGRKMPADIVKINSEKRIGTKLTDQQKANVSAGLLKHRRRWFNDGNLNKFLIESIGISDGLSLGRLRIGGFVNCN